MVPFGKQQEICAIFRSQVQETCQETAGRLLLEDGLVVITNEKSAYRTQSDVKAVLPRLDGLFRVHPTPHLARSLEINLRYTQSGHPGFTQFLSEYDQFSFYLTYFLKSLRLYAVHSVSAP